MNFQEYRRYDAHGLAELVARREVSARELLETAIARSAEVNPKINAVVQASPSAHVKRLQGRAPSAACRSS